MIRFVVADELGAIRRTGHSSSTANALLQKREGERIVVVLGDDPGLIDANRLMVDFNQMMICRQPDVNGEVQGDGTAVLEITEVPEDEG